MFIRRSVLLGMGLDIKSWETLAWMGGSLYGILEGAWVGEYQMALGDRENDACEYQ